MNTEEEVYTPEAPQRVGIIGEIWGFLRVRKAYWLAPIIMALLFLGLLFFLAAGAGPLSPFIYML